MNILLKPPFVLYISAKRNSGKTVLLNNLLTQDKFYKNKFDKNKIFIFSPTYHLDDSYDGIDVPDSNIFTDYSTDYIDDMFTHCNKVDDILLVFDDCISEEGFKQSKTSNPLNRIATIGRHYKISMIILSQKLNAISSVIRTNIDGLILFSNPSRAEQKCIYDNFGIGTSEQFRQIFEYCTKEPYSFMYINNQTKKLHKKFNPLMITFK